MVVAGRSIFKLSLLAFLSLTVSIDAHAQNRKLELVQGTFALVQGEDILTKNNPRNEVSEVIVTPFKSFKLTNAQKKRFGFDDANRKFSVGDSVRVAVFKTATEKSSVISEARQIQIAQIKKKTRKAVVQGGTSGARTEAAIGDGSTQSVFAAIVVDFGTTRNTVNDRQLKSQLGVIAAKFNQKTGGRANYTVQVHRVKAKKASETYTSEDQRNHELTELSFNAFDQFGCSVTRYADFKKLQEACGITTVAFMWPDGYYPYPAWGGTAMITGPVMWLRKYGAKNYNTNVIQHELGHALYIKDPYSPDKIADNSASLKPLTGGGHASLSDPNDIFSMVDEYYDGEQDFLGNCWKRTPDEFNFPHLAYAFRVMPPEQIASFNVAQPGNSLTVTLSDIGNFPAKGAGVTYGVQIGGQAGCGAPFLPMYTVSLKEGQISLHTLSTLKNIRPGRFWDNANSNTYLFDRFSSGTWRDTKGIFKKNGLKIEVLSSDKKGGTIRVSNDADPDPAATSAPTCAPTATVTPSPTATGSPVATPTKVPSPTATSSPSKTPQPTVTSDSTKSPAPTGTSGSTKTPAPTVTSGATGTPDSGGGQKPGDGDGGKNPGGGGGNPGGGGGNPGGGGGNPGGGGGNPGNGGGGGDMGGGGGDDPAWDDTNPQNPYLPSCTDSKTGTRTLSFYCCCAVYYNPAAKSGIKGGMIWQMSQSLSESKRSQHPGLCSREYARCTGPYLDNNREVKCTEWDIPAKCLDMAPVK